MTSVSEGIKIRILNKTIQEATQSGARIVNLTPHVIRLKINLNEEPASQYGNNLDVIEIPSSGSARCNVSAKEVGRDPVYGLPVFARVTGEVEGLPAPEPGVTYIVSSMVLEKTKEAGRTDCMAPDTGPSAVREGGQVYAVTQWVV